MAKDIYETRRKERPGIKRLGQTPEAMSRRMKPAGTMRPFPKRKVKPKVGIKALSKTEKALGRSMAGRISKKIFGRLVPGLGLAYLLGDMQTIGRAGVEGYKALKAAKELRDLETALKKKTRKEKK